jgi:carbon storage regulator
MLVLSRKVGETVVIAGSISVTVVAIQGDNVRVGVTAPANIPVDREEIHRLKELEQHDLHGVPLAPGDQPPVSALRRDRRARAEPSPLTERSSMRTPKKRYALTKKNVDRAPAVGGVYALFEGPELIFFGRALGGAETIRSRLQAHQAGSNGDTTRRATHYRRQRCADPAAKEQALLAAYAGAHQGRLPRCNEGAS